MAKRLTKAERATNSIVQTYKAAKQVKERTQQKLDALFESNAFYRVFDFEEKDKHPYHHLADIAKQVADQVETLVAGIKDWQIDQYTIAEQMEKIKAEQIWSKQDEDADLDYLRSIQAVAMTENEATERFLNVLETANHLRNIATKKHIRSDLETLVTNEQQKPKLKKQLVARHSESDPVDLAKDCVASFQSVKKLGKDLLACGNGSSTIRDELAAIKEARTQSGSGYTYWSTWYLKV
jgi:hypothetical protein